MLPSPMDASAVFIILDWVGSFNQTLVETVPHNEPYTNPGTEVLNATIYNKVSPVGRS